MIALNRRRYMGGGGAIDEIIMTSLTNPEVMAICYAQNWAAHADYMTKREAEAVTNVGTVFYNNTSITHFEEFQYFTNVTSLSSQAFRGCTNLDSIVIPPLVTSLPDYCFYRCGISSISIPEGVTTIGNSVFNMNGTSTSDRHLHSITYPSTVTDMGSEIHLYGVLTTMTVKAIVPPTLSGVRMFSYGSIPSVIYVPAGSVEDYKTAQNWSTWANKYQAIPT